MTADDVWLDAASSAAAIRNSRASRACSRGARRLDVQARAGMNGMVRMAGAGASIANSTMSAMGSEACAALDLVATSGRRFARVRAAQAGGTSAVIAAGTHSDPANTVSVWSAAVASDLRLADRLLDHEEEIVEGSAEGARARPPLAYRVDGDVTALEFWGGPRTDGSMRLWTGSSEGSVRLLCAQRYDFETDDQGNPMEAFQVQQVAAVERQGQVPLHSLAVSALAVLPSLEHVLSCGEDGKVWSVACSGPGVTASPLGRGDSVALYDIKYADKTGESFLTAGAAGGIKRWSPRTGGETAVLAATAGCPWTALEICNDFYVISGRSDGQLALFDARAPRQAVAELGRNTAADPQDAHATAAAAACPLGPITGLSRAGQDDFIACALDGTLMRFEVKESAARGGVFVLKESRQYTCALNDVCCTSLHRGLRTQVLSVSVLSVCIATDGSLCDTIYARSDGRGRYGLAARPCRSSCLCVYNAGRPTADQCMLGYQCMRGWIGMAGDS